MTLTPEQLDEAKQLLGVAPDHAGGVATDGTEPLKSETPVEATADTTADTPTETAPAVSDNTLSVYCPNCSHLLAKVSNNAD